MIRTENWRKNQTAGKKGLSRLRTSFQRQPAATLSSLASRNRQRNAHIGRWCMASDRTLCENGVTLFEIHPLHRAGCNDRSHRSSFGIDDDFRDNFVGDNLLN